MDSLWDSQDLARWDARRASYAGVLAALGKPELAILDAWYFRELCSSLSRATVLAKPDLVRLVDWKLRRGTFRPRLLDFARAAPEALLADASARALAALRRGGGEPPLPAVREALAALAEVKGVGPATASAVASAATASVPFMSDPALLAALGRKEYTLPAAVALTDALRRRAAELNRRSGGGGMWTPREIERCLWAEDRAAPEGGKAGEGGKAAGAARKRKR